MEVRQELEIDIQEVLRYLGHRGQTVEEPLMEMIRETAEECRSIAKPRYMYRIYSLDRDEASLYLNGTTIRLPGNDIQGHLKNASMVAVMAATLGIEIEQQIRLWERRDMTKALVMDAAATDLVEKLCGRVQGEIHKEAEGRQMWINTRYSPGYGDLPLEIQPTIIEALQTQKIIGLTCTENLIMLPRKSVTALIGLFREKPEPILGSSCETCIKFQDCTYRRGGACYEPE